MIDFLEVCCRDRVILNFDKFQFSQPGVEFNGFCVTDTKMKPLDKCLHGILEFTILKSQKTFGPGHQLSHYNKLTDMMKPFKLFLSPKVKFQWDDELDGVFNHQQL